MNSVGIIGGGNLGISIAEGVVNAGFAEAKNVVVTRRKKELLADLAEKGFQISSNNLDALHCKFIVLALKPHKMAEILVEISSQIDPEKHIIISVATGVSITFIQNHLANPVPVFRAMPNTAVAIGESMTCLCTDRDDQELKAKVEGLFNCVGKSIFIEESLMAASTALGACGIAFALRFIRAASQGGIEIGFDSKSAQIIATQTVKGAAALLHEGGMHPEHEIDKVTTPQGCTIAGLNEMEHQGFSSSLIKGILTSFGKIGTM